MGSIRKKTDGLLKSAAPSGRGTSADLSLLPFYRVHHQHYSVYWDVAGSLQAAAHPRRRNGLVRVH